MIAGIYFTGTGPILILTTYPALDDSGLAEKLAAKGIKKFMACEVPVEQVHMRYGIRYDVVAKALSPKEDLRVLDYNGHHVFFNFSLQELGKPVLFEP